MRIILSIALFVICLLPRGMAYAGEVIPYFSGEADFSSKEEFRARWESEENARLMGEEAVKSFRMGENSGLTLNSLCSAESISGMSELRSRLASIIEKSGDIGYAGVESILAAKILERAAGFCVTGLSQREKKLIELVHSLPVKNDNAEAKNLCGGASTQEGITLFFAAGAPYSPGGGLTFNPSGIKKRASLQYIEKIDPGRNFETAHADYYRLFLYMRDDTGDSACNKSTSSHPAFNPQLFNTFQPVVQNSRLPKTDRKFRSHSISVSGLFQTSIQLFLSANHRSTRPAGTPFESGGEGATTIIMEGFYHEA